MVQRDDLEYGQKLYTFVFANFYEKITNLQNFS